MAKELNFQDGNDVLKYQDTTAKLKLYLSENGLPFDLSRFDALTLKVGNTNGYLLQKNLDPTTFTDPTSGNLTIALDNDIMNKLVPDDYNIELWGQINPITYNPSPNSMNITVASQGLQDEQAIFPSDGNLVITVDENIKASPFETINAYPIDDVWNSIQQWKNDTSQSISTSLSSQLLDEIRHWQGDISDSLKNELLQDIANDESTIQKSLNDVLTNSLDSLINQQIATLTTNLNHDMDNRVVDTVSQQVSNMKPQLQSDLHSSLSSELSNELSSSVASYESSASSSLGSQLSQSVADRTNAMQGALSTQLTQFIQDKLNSYQTTTTNNITTSITTQVTQSIADQFNAEDSKVRADLEEMVNTTIQNSVNKTLQQMQQNGDIYATKAEFDNFTSQINTDLQKLNIANDIGKQIDVINQSLQSIPTIQSDVAELKQTGFKFFGNVPSTNLTNITTDGIYNLGGQTYTDGPHSGPIYGTILQNGRGVGVQSQLIFENTGRMHFRMINGWGTEGWFEITKDSDLKSVQNSLSSAISSVASSASSRISSLQSVSSSQAGSLSSVANSVSNNSSAIASNASNISNLQSSVSTNSSAISSVSSSASYVVSSLSSSTNSSLSSLSSNVTSLSNSAVQFVRSLTNTDDLNTISTPGIYGLNGVTPANTPNNTLYSGILEVKGQQGSAVQVLNTSSGVFNRAAVPGLNIQETSVNQTTNGNVQTFQITLGGNPTITANTQGNLVVSIPQSSVNGWVWSSAQPVTTSMNSSFATGGNFDNQINWSSTAATTNAFVLSIPLNSMANGATYQTTAMTSSNGAYTHTDHFVAGQFTFSYNSSNQTLTMTSSIYSILNGPSWSNASTFGNQFISNITNLSNSLTSLNGSSSSMTVTPCLNTWNPTISTNQIAWGTWTQNATENDISNVNNNVNTAIAQINSTTTNIQNQITNVNKVYTLNPGTDFNQIPNDGIYDLANLPYTSYENAFYNGPGIQLQQRTDSTGGTQMVWSNNDGNTPQFSYRVRTNGVWGRWILLASIDNVMGNTLCFRGDTPGNALYQITTSGIYNLAGKNYIDWNSQPLWGQLVVMNTGGVTNQTIRNNTGNIWVQSLNSWGNTGWQSVH